MTLLWERMAETLPDFDLIEDDEEVYTESEEEFDGSSSESEEVSEDSNTSSTSEEVTEIWRELDDYPGYKISNLGNILMKNGKISETSPYRDGYRRVVVTNKDGKRIPTGIHNLVAQAFLEKLPDKIEVNHKNCKRDDNRLVNLEWVTRSENCLKRLNRHGRSSRGVVKFDLEGNILGEWPSSIIAGKENNFNAALIAHACTKQLVYKGFRWLYLDTVQVFPDEVWTQLQVGDRIISVSSMGRVETAQGITFGSETAQGYMGINLAISGRMQFFGVHRLIAQGFKPNPKWRELEVNHWDNNGKNNKIDNLFWVTHQENAVHAIDFKKSEVCRARSVNQIANDGVTVIATFRSISEASKQTGIHAGGIRRVCKTEKGNSGGYIWRYAIKTA